MGMHQDALPALFSVLRIIPCQFPSFIAWGLCLSRRDKQAKYNRFSTMFLRSTLEMVQTPTKAAGL